MPPCHPGGEAAASSRFDPRPCREETELEGGSTDDHRRGPNAAHGEKLGCGEEGQSRVVERFRECKEEKEGTGGSEGWGWGGWEVD